MNLTKSMRDNPTSPEGRGWLVFRSAAQVSMWLPDMDLNHDKQIQSLLCYRYTIRQSTDERLTSPA